MMIKQIFKMIWNQRRLNGWIWMELLVVFVALWYLVDMFVVQLYSYTRPMGYDITNCWKLSFDVYPEDADEYVNDTTQTQTEGEALAKILERLRRAPEVDNACVAFYSSPYSGGNSWTQIMPCTASHFCGSFLFYVDIESAECCDSCLASFADAYYGSVA